MPLVSLIYVSSAKEIFSTESLLALLEISRFNNRRDGVTGMLLYKNGNFIQAIEGEAETIRQLHEKILRDPRHHGLITLLEKSIPQREFPEWSMGFQNLADLALRDVPGYSEFLNLTLNPQEVSENLSPALKLLQVFRRKM